MKMLNVIYKNYDKLKPKQKKTERNFSYHNNMLVQLGQIVRIDNFRELLDLDLDIALNIKLTEGVVGITYERDKYQLVFNISAVGLPRKDGRPNKLIGTYIDNEQVYTKEYTNDMDIVLWYNNALATPESTIDYFSYMFTETDTSIEYNIQRSRYNPYIKVKTEKQKQQYMTAMQNTHNGEPIVIVDDEDNLLDDDKQLTVDVNDVKNVDKIQYLQLFYDHLNSRYSQLYGFPITNNAKHAQQSVEEVGSTEAYSWLIPVDMLNQAKEFCKRMSDMFNIELVAHFGMLHELNFSKFTKDCTVNDETENEDLHDVDDVDDVDDEEQEDDESGND